MPCQLGIYPLNSLGTRCDIAFTLAFWQHSESKSNSLSHSGASGSLECESELDFYSKNRQNARMSSSLTPQESDGVTGATQEEPKRQPVWQGPHGRRPRVRRCGRGGTGRRSLESRPSGTTGCWEAIRELRRRLPLHASLTSCGGIGVIKVV